ncbi:MULTISPECIES: hypothetical protein [Arthrobacter]|uniref:Uncharacterized protein n=1 Tax=Arthrobacter terricola TaxID=2547396 RepID=A0A4V2ZRX9_9MICC|nr:MULTISPECIES: hypothetical protein [Arthrobacter]MBT8159989.1 hypothetical protein [Arthrobacter sp. GN70]TDF91064.1 hypothetical protein E1809_21620 [Arthrobacter terricola]
MIFTSKTRVLLTTILIGILVAAGLWYLGRQAQAISGASPATATASATPDAATGDDVEPVQPGDSGPAAVPDAAVAQGSAPKAIHSPDKVSRDLTLTPNQCKVRILDAVKGEILPDASCTPGAIDPAVTEANISSTICKSGYTTTVRAPVSDTDKVKKLSLQQYGLAPSSSTEYDHLISLQLGGTNAVSNLWPEPNREGAPGTTNPKDAIETRLNKAVCSHRVTLADAQKAIARNWVTAEKDLGL